jgi:iron(III) transport system permease protein
MSSAIPLKARDESEMTTRLLTLYPNSIVRGLLKPVNLIGGAILVVLAYLIVLPLVQLIIRTVIWGEGDRRFSRDAVEGEFTWFHWNEALAGGLSKEMLYEPLLNTMVTGISSAALALTLGSLLAWAVVRTDLPGKKILRPILTIPYVVPSFAIALAWITVFKSPRLGGQPGLWQSFFDAAPPVWLSSGPVPIILAMAVHYFPFAFLLVSGALSTIDSQLEECAEIQGASRIAILRRITFPVVAPAMVAALVLTFGKTLGTFALPYLLGSSTDYNTVATVIFSALALGFDALSYVLVLILISITAVMIYLSHRLVGKNAKRFATISGKGFRSRLTKLGVWRWPVCATVWVIALVTAIIPLGLLAYQTFQLVDGMYGFDNLTLHYWIGRSDPGIAFGEPGVLHNSVILGATWTTIKLALISSVVASLLGLVIGYIVVRQSDSPIASLLDQISFTPLLFPSIALGAMYISMFAESHGPIPALYGTFTILVIISVVNRLPYTVRTGTSAITQISHEMEEAAEIQGASWFRRFTRIVAPLAVSGALSGTMVSFVGVMRELTLIILLITPSTRVLMTVGFRYAEEDQTQLGNALVLIVTVLTLLGELVMWKLGSGKLARLREREAG